MPAYLSLGANLGDRIRQLAAARAQLAATPEIRITAESPLYETSPHGVPAPQPDYLNQVLQIETTRTPEQLLACCLEIERQLGRTRPHHHAPRTIDIDLLLHGDAVRDTPQLQLPHPRMTERAFVLVPLADIAPALLINNTPIKTLLARLDTGTVKEFSQTT